MQLILKTFLTGGICGAIFAFSKLPIPAPVAFAGLMGIVGIYVGYSLVTGIWL